MKTQTNFQQRSFKLAVLSAFALGTAIVSGSSAAATATGTFAVSATVTASCTVTGTPLAFGAFSTSGGNVDVSNSLSATCTNGSGYTIGLSAGTTAGATVGARKMIHSGGISTLNYSLSTVSAGGTNWDDTGGANVAAGTGNGAAQNISVFGRIPSGQTSALAGTYSDTITATITF